MATASQMVKALTDALTKNIGVRQITVDGQTITFDSRKDMLDELGFWEKKAAKEAGTRNRFRVIDISGSGSITSS